MYNWRVIEDNGGGLALEVSTHEGVVYAHTGYEHMSPDPMRGLARDLAALLDGGDVAEWDGNEADAHTPYPPMDRGPNNEWRVVAWGGDDIYTVRPWGAAGKRALLGI